jgi:hypothetical protein
MFQNCAHEFFSKGLILLPRPQRSSLSTQYHSLFSHNHRAVAIQTLRAGDVLPASAFKTVQHIHDDAGDLFGAPLARSSESAFPLEIRLDFQILPTFSRTPVFTVKHSVPSNRAMRSPPFPLQTHPHTLISAKCCGCQSLPSKGKDDSKSYGSTISTYPFVASGSSQYPS